MFFDRLFNRTMKTDGFSTLFQKHSEVGVEASNALFHLFDQDDSSQVTVIDNLEHVADKIAAEVYRLYDNTFIHPFDKEDILKLINHLDNIVDGIKRVALRKATYKISSKSPYGSLAKKFLEIIDIATIRLHTTIAKLPKTNWDEVSKIAVSINQLEDQADQLFNQALELMFPNLSDPVTVEMYAWREVYELLETITDDCQHAADTLQSIARRQQV